ncbi:MAG: LLM class flavin-dependent oxidoreductase [Opitutaceae bacterium]|nr:LLM class flavin-dependent oxidoreductase [Opitutaceae bacterium]
MVPFSVLDLCPVPQGGTVSDALRATLDLARHVEQLDYRRFWLAEHHSMPGIASAATSVVIAHVAAGTSKIRVGSGGIMLPNHAPLVIAEQFGTLEALFPGRIDLGLGRAPGTDQFTARALRQGRKNAVDTFPQDVMELQAYLQPPSPGQPVVAVPGAGSQVPLWILGSSLFGAQLAAALGLPYAFASHFSPDHLEEALAIYRREFQPSANLPKPYAMAAIGLFAADTDREARRLFSSWQQSFLNLRRGEPGLLTPPVDDISVLASPAELAGVTAAFREAIVGSPATVQTGIADFLERTRVDELMLTSAIYDQGARKRSFEIAAGIRRKG